MEPQGGASVKVVRSINNIWNTTIQHYQQQTQQQQAGAEPGRTQEALAGFAKGLKHLYTLYQGCFSS